MASVLRSVFEMSLTASAVILAVLLARLLLRKAPRKYSYALWAAAAFRLVCPVSFRAAFSLFSLTRRVEGAGLSQLSPGLPPADFAGTAAPPADSAVTVLPPAVTDPSVGTQVSAGLSAMDVLAVLWLAGIAALLIYAVVSYVLLRRRMSTAVRLEGNVWQSERVRSPFVLGVLKPRIYLPYGLTGEQTRYVLAHERYHLKRLDHAVRPLAFLILTVHWFNPLVWAAFLLMGRDMEMSCDEAVLAREEDAGRAYSATLLSFAANRRFPSPSPLAFGEGSVKTRIKNALNWRRPRLWVTAAAIVLCIAVLAACTADPLDKAGEDLTGVYVTDQVVYYSMLSSAIYWDDNGCVYTVTDDGLEIRSQEGDAYVCGDTAFAGDWEPLTEEAWEELFSDPGIGWGIPDISGLKEPMIRRTEQGYYTLLNMDGELWVMQDTFDVIWRLRPRYAAEEAQKTPYDWTSTLHAANIDGAELTVTEEKDVTYTLEEGEHWKLAELLNGLASGDLAAAEKWGAGDSAGRRLAICCNGVEYVFRLEEDGRLTLRCEDEHVNWKGGSVWDVDSPELAEYMRMEVRTDGSRTELTVAADSMIWAAGPDGNGPYIHLGPDGWHAGGHIAMSYAIGGVWEFDGTYLYLRESNDQNSVLTLVFRAGDQWICRLPVDQQSSGSAVPTKWIFCADLSENAAAVNWFTDGMALELFSPDALSGG